MTIRTFPWKRLFRYAVPILFTVLWIAFIFSNSLQNGVESGNQSHMAQEWLDQVFHNAGLKNPISEGLLRKLAHFGEFAILALFYIGDVLAFGYISLVQPLGRTSLFLFSSVPVCFLVACVDEFLQRFSVGRASQFTDVLIDTSGALTATLCFFAVFCLVRYRKSKKASHIN